jgi:hypothetical protein
VLSWLRKRHRTLPKDELEDVAREISPVLVRELLPQARDYYAEFAARNHEVVITQQHIWDAQLEEFFFCLSLLDRAVFGKLGPANRTVFMDAVFANVCESIHDTFAAAVPDESFRAWFKQTLNLKQSEYGSWQFPSGDNLKGTIMWEFGKKMTFSLGVTNPVEVFLLEHRAAGLFKLMLQLVDGILNG